MPGTVLENLSNRKLSYIALLEVSMLLFWVLIGGFYSPDPSSVIITQATNCKSTSGGAILPWKVGNISGCETVDPPEKKDDKDTVQDLVHEDTVFAAHAPRTTRYFSPLNQFLVIMWAPTINQITDLVSLVKIIKLDVAFYYRDLGDKNYTLMARRVVDRRLECSDIEDEDSSMITYACDSQPLVELGACSHAYYLVNIRIAHTQDGYIGDVLTMNTPVIFQSYDHTVVWFMEKTLYTPMLLCAMIWYWRRIRMLSRPPELIEKAILFSSVCAFQYAFPVEWLSLFIDFPFNFFVNDIREGLFLVSLLLFWVVFTDEHIIKKSERNYPWRYWKEATCILAGCVFFFIFNTVERGVQMFDPFYSVWTDETSASISTALIYCGGLCGLGYILFLFQLVFRVLSSFRKKAPNLPRMPPNKQLAYSSIVFRFYFLMVGTFCVAILTIVFFFMSSIRDMIQMQFFSKDLFDDNDDELEFSTESAMNTGVFAVWMTYMISLLFMYAPSHKYASGTHQVLVNACDLEGESDEELNPDASNPVVHYRDLGEPIVYTVLGKERQD